MYAAEKFYARDAYEQKAWNMHGISSGRAICAREKFKEWDFYGVQCCVWKNSERAVLFFGISKPVWRDIRHCDGQNNRKQINDALA